MELYTKKEICQMHGWTADFFDSIPMPRYPIGKRDYFRLEDVDPAIESLRKEPEWESSKSKARPTINLSSRFGVSDIEAVRKQIKEQKRKRSTNPSAGGSC